jgi:hypothetical protein
MKTATCATRAGSFALCFALALGCIACKPAVADTATFSNGAIITVTLPNVADVTYTVISNELSVSSFSSVNSGLVTNSQFFSWNNGILSYEFYPASGWTSSPTGESYGESTLSRTYFTTLEIANTNGYSVELPILSSLTLDGSATSSGVASSDSVAYVDFDSIPAFISPLSFDTTLRCLEESIDGSIASEGCDSYSSGSGGPTAIPASMTASMFLPADSIGDFTLIADSSGDAYIPSTVPEPGTFVLLSTAAGLGLAGAVRRKLLLRP